MKKIISTILAALILTTTFPAPVMSLAATSTTVSASEKYWNGENEVSLPTGENVVTISSASDFSEFKAGKTYIFQNKVTIDKDTFRPIVDGTVSIILMDGAELTVKRGIGVHENMTLNIYAQHENQYYEENKGVKQGKLSVSDVAFGNAGIGGSGGLGGRCGTLNIYGGVLDIIGGKAAAGIGGGNGGNGGTINISGGIINAEALSDTNITGQNGAGIGGGMNGSGGTINISGGIVTAVAFNGESTCFGGAGIGGGNGGAAGVINICGKAVIRNAQGLNGGAGIGGGAGVSSEDDMAGSGGIITISDNAVIENAQSVCEQGISSVGIGSGFKGNLGTVAISDNAVIRNAKGVGAGAGIGGAFNENLVKGSFSAEGSPAIYAEAGPGSEAISAFDEKSSGLIITKSQGKLSILGTIPDDFTLTSDFTIPSGIETGLTFKNLTVAPGVKLTQNSAITVTGKLTNEGKLDGNDKIFITPSGSVTGNGTLPTGNKVIQYSGVTLSAGTEPITVTEGSDAEFTIHVAAENDAAKEHDVTTGTIEIFEGNTTTPLATSTLSGSPAASHEADFHVTVTKPDAGTHSLRAEFTYKDFDGYTAEQTLTLTVNKKPNPVPGGSDDDDDDDDNGNNTGNNSSHGSTPGQKPAKPAPDTSSENHKWVSENDNWKLIDENGTPAVGWKMDSENWFFLDENGIMLTGWQFVDGNWFYLNPVSDGTKGAMKTGWIFVDNEWFYLNPVSDGSKGSMKTGWQFVDGEWYYLNPVSDGTRGRMMTGQVLIDGKQYFFNPVSDGTKGRWIP